MTVNKRKIGAQHEQKAGAYLEEKGYEILEFNYRCRQGEIDIIAKDGEYLVFCEVKYRSGLGAGYPAEAVDYKKQRTISRCALFYLTKQKLLDAPCRFDVISMSGNQIEHIENAFDYIGG